MQTLIVILCGITLGFMYLAGKKVSNSKYNSATISAVYSLLSAIIIFPFMLTTFKLPSSPWIWGLSIISPITFGVANLAMFKAYKTTDVSAVSLVNRLSVVVSTVAGILILNDAVPRLILPAIIAILIGSSLIVYEGGKLKVSAGIVLAVLGAVGFGIVAPYDKLVLQEYAPLTYVFVNNMVVVLFFLSMKTVRKELVPIIKEFPIPTITMSLFGVGSWALFLTIISKFSIIMLYPIWESVALITTVVGGVLMFKEKTLLVQKIVGTAITVLGIVLLSL